MTSSLYFEEFGAGDPIILLHGFAESTEVWLPLTEELKNQFRLIVIDLPGFGNSPEPEGEFSLEDIANQIHDFLNEIGLVRYSIVGHSLGGYVALALAGLYPENIQTLILLHSTAGPDSEEKKHSRNKTIAFLQKNRGLNFLASFVPPLFSIPKRDWIDRILLKAQNIKDTTLIAYTKAMRDRANREDVLSFKEFKSLIIAGEHDTILPVDLLEKQSKSAKNASFSLLRGSGHMGMLEQTRVVAGIISTQITLSKG